MNRRLPPTSTRGTIVDRGVQAKVMRVRAKGVAVLAGILVSSACSPRETVGEEFGDRAQKLRVVNREATKIQDRNGMRLSAAPGNGVAWVEGTDFRSGTIEVDIRGREALQQSYVGVAFHRDDDNTSRSKCGSSASSMAARSGCGWATTAAATSPTS